MERRIHESFATATPAVECFICHRTVRYYDRLDDESLVCLSCSYRYGFQPTEDAVLHGREFDPQDEDLRIEMARISQIDIDRSDKDVCSISAVIPEDLWEPLSKLMKLNGSSLNSEIVSALGWYSTLCLNQRSSAPIDFSNMQSIKAESSELTEILRADDPGVHTP